MKTLITLFIISGIVNYGVGLEGGENIDLEFDMTFQKPESEDDGKYDRDVIVDLDDSKKTENSEDKMSVSDELNQILGDDDIKNSWDIGSDILNTTNDNIYVPPDSNLDGDISNTIDTNPIGSNPSDSNPSDSNPSDSNPSDSNPSDSDASNLNPSDFSNSSDLLKDLPKNFNDFDELERICETSQAQPSEVRKHFNGYDINDNALGMHGRKMVYMLKRKMENSRAHCPTVKVQCDPETFIRSPDGYCNNLENPGWGAYLSGFKYMIKSFYEDGVIIPRGAVYKPGIGYQSRLPNPRKISSLLFKASNDSTESSKLTQMFMQFGQFVDHDIAKSSKEDWDCCGNDKLAKSDRCFNIDVSNDTFYQEFGRKCMDFTRSNVKCDSKDGTVVQFNGVSAFIDGSAIYGTHPQLAYNLRGGTGRKNGLLVDNQEPNLKHYLPKYKNIPNMDLIKSSRDPEIFLSGDDRCMAQPTLLSMHSLWLKEHNRIATELKKAFKDKLNEFSILDQDEILYQITRRIVIAELQNIVYNEYLPAFLSQETLNKFNLKLTENSNYDASVDSSIRNEFATVAYRWGHTLVQSVFKGK